jgi:hypothetical protein
VVMHLVRASHSLLEPRRPLGLYLSGYAIHRINLLLIFLLLLSYSHVCKHALYFSLTHTHIHSLTLTHYPPPPHTHDTHKHTISQSFTQTRARACTRNGRGNFGDGHGGGIFGGGHGSSMSMGGDNSLTSSFRDPRKKSSLFTR